LPAAFTPRSTSFRCRSQAFNRYAYARDNPITYTDPTGHSFWSVLGGIFSSIAGALFSVLAAIARAVTWAVNLYVDAVKRKARRWSSGRMTSARPRRRCHVD
jgi:hypothetical protein